MSHHVKIYNGIYNSSYSIEVLDQCPAWVTMWN
jgi:hypothetical protein